MYCLSCGKEVGENAYVCIHCGAKVPVAVSQKAPAVPGTGLGIFSMIMGIISIACCSGVTVFSIVGLITGIIARKQSKEAGQKNGYATAGVTCSAISLGIAVLGVIAYIVYCVVIVALVGAASSSAYYY